MEEAAREWVAQGLKPSKIRSGFLRRFNIDETSLPPLSVVQRFVHNYATSHLRNNYILVSVKAKIHEAVFTNEENGEAFTFAWENDADGRPTVGNGSDHLPVIIGMTTKTLLKRVDRDPGSFIFHLDATYKLCQVAYPVLVVGISDKMRSFHLVAILIMPQQMQLHHARALTALRNVYLAVMHKPLVVRYVMLDADKAQRNGVDEVFGRDCSIVYEKAKNLEASLFAKILHDVHDLHFTTSDHEYEETKSRVLADWASWPELARFMAYFTETWLASRFSQWQVYHSPSGIATTNNPVEQYNAVLKRDVTPHRKLKMGVLLGRLLDWCRLESARAAPFATATVADARLHRRAREMERTGLLSELVVSRHSVAFMLGETPDEVMSQDVVYVRSLPANRSYNEDLRRRHEDLPVSAQLGQNTARMKKIGCHRQAGRSTFA
ncbi:hypothetical protein F442_04722 [Phytophthora nicotianae P10297]|uniref:MULE transposase domain-containing protein n=2 Tax=Phytophthora nicotianae TaxID=4792 RepID=W2ZR59_PHYNI|nr:hypothetical protein L914_04490 [Phytophthora nicotianae]ETP49837.1 hypothetical protein F442_04722 [Phytophthora nicotianae P10297]